MALIISCVATPDFQPTEFIRAIAETEKKEPGKFTVYVEWMIRLFEYIPVHSVYQ